MSVRLFVLCEYMPLSFVRPTDRRTLLDALLRATSPGDAEALLRGALAALRRDNYRAVRPARTVQRSRIRALQHSHRCNVVRVEVRRRVADVVATQRAPDVAIV